MNRLSEEDLREQVREIVTRNINEGYSERYDFNYCVVQPSSDIYQYQYYWDTCLHIFILTALGEQELPKKLLRSLYGMQERNGFVGHILYWNRLKPNKWHDVFQSKFKNLFYPHMSSLIQPPLAAQALERIWNQTRDRQLLLEMVPKLKKHFDWLAENRDLDGDGLISIISMFESGMDWKPTMDPLLGFKGKGNALLYIKAVFVDIRNFFKNYQLKKIHKARYFLMKEVALNTIYAQNLDTLAKLCRRIGDEDADKYSQRFDKVRQSVKEKMFSPEDNAFWDIDVRTNEWVKIATPTIFFPMVLRIKSKKEIEETLKAHFYNDEEFFVKYPIPSVGIKEESFNPEKSDYIWRGPTWVLYNWFVYQCLFYNDFKEEAKKLRETIIELIEKSGFREYYNPFTGEGYGAQNFTWSGLVVDMLNLRD